MLSIKQSLIFDPFLDEVISAILTVSVGILLIILMGLQPLEKQN